MFFSSHTDLPEPFICCQSCAHLRHLVRNGHLGILHRWRFTQKPQTLPNLQRQGLPAFKPPVQIIQHVLFCGCGFSIQRHMLFHLRVLWMGEDQRLM